MLLIKQKVTQCVLIVVLASASDHLGKDIPHSAIYWSSETFPFLTEGFCHVVESLSMCVSSANAGRRLNERFKKKASNCSKMSRTVVAAVVRVVGGE